MRTVMIVFLLLLSACSEPGANSLCLTVSCERARDAERQRISETRDNQACADYGLGSGTPEYADCRLRLAEMRRNRALEGIRALGQPPALPKVQPPATPPPSPRNTSCNIISGQMNCASY